jgi:hypothetical protein
MAGRFARFVMPAALASLVLASCGRLDPAANVGEESISQEAMTAEAKRVGFLSDLNGQPCGSPDLAAGDTEEAACNRAALSNLITESLVVGFALQRDIVVDAQEIVDSIAELDRQLGAEEVDARLESFDLTRADLDAIAREILLFDRVRQAVTAEQLDEDELRELYANNRLRFSTIDVQHILVTSEEEANEIYSLVTTQGATEQDFTRLARKRSIDPSARENGGELGSATASTYVPEFAQAALSLDEGEISLPVQTQFGWHVIRLVSKDVTPFERARRQLLLEQAPVAFSDWLKERANRERVEVNPRFGAWDVNSLSVIRVTSTDPLSPQPPETSPVELQP